MYAKLLASTTLLMSIAAHSACPEFLNQDYRKLHSTESIKHSRSKLCRAGFQAAVLIEPMPCFEHRTNHGLPGLPLVDSSHPAVSRLSEK